MPLCIAGMQKKKRLNEKNRVMLSEGWDFPPSSLKLGFPPPFFFRKYRISKNLCCHHQE
jgi:hypothetical protein